MAQPTRRNRLRAVSAERARLLRARKAIERRHHGPPRCHWPEGCTRAADEHHETVRRSQYREGAADDELMVPLCRAHHDWVGDHPREAHDRYRLSIPRWELDAERAECNTARVSPVAIRITPPADPLLPPPEPRTRLISIRLNLPALAWVDRLSEEHKHKRSTVLRAMLTVASAHEAEIIERLRRDAAGHRPRKRRVPPVPAEPTTITGRKRGPVPKKKS